ncbi:MAG TPA: hypothetical protein VFB20_08145 [Burkholderiales bacterium]|nr:hypothetical protein [Burkholderiales bacterium]
MLQKILLICLIAVLLASCGGRRRAERSTMSSCSVPMAGVCKPCRIACPAGQTPKCVAGQGDETTCNQPASCTCE